jgi:hypothetical protein
MSDTPETNSVLKEIKQHKIAFYTQECNFEGGKVSFESPIVSLCRKLERERDEAREQIKELIYIGERAIALADIDFENDKFGVVSELRADLEKIKEGAK